MSTATAFLLSLFCVKNHRLHLFVEEGCILGVSFFFLSLSRPGVNFLSRPVSDPEHSLPHSNLRHHSRLLLPPVPPLDSPVRHGAAMMGRTGGGGSGARPREGEEAWTCVFNRLIFGNTVVVKSSPFIKHYSN